MMDLCTGDWTDGTKDCDEEAKFTDHKGISDVVLYHYPQLIASAAAILCELPAGPPLLFPISPVLRSWEGLVDVSDKLPIQHDCRKQTVVNPLCSEFVNCPVESVERLSTVTGAAELPGKYRTRLYIAGQMSAVPRTRTTRYLEIRPLSATFSAHISCQLPDVDTAAPDHLASDTVFVRPVLATVLAATTC
ncbi:hypothetical protein J6590_012933 [Homalodisca vitripennis]|nr:hypothetical protein J6590_012933 [Homalodisca vitripennis]